ncbi:MAG: methyltransferase domain-containing protein [Patescibacteria group bacterium]
MKNKIIITEDKMRKLMAELFIAGQGVEIGALHNPLDVSLGVKVKYVDRLSVGDLRKQYPELNNLKLVSVDIICDGEKLEKIPDDSQDFVIANHFLEHCEDPIKAIKNMLRVINSGGFVYLAIPNKEHSFDIDRPVTTFNHLERDYARGPLSSRKKHFEEWVKLVNKTQGRDEIEQAVNSLMKNQYSIHFHVWDTNELLSFFVKIQKYFSFEIMAFIKNGSEIIVILSK